MRLGNSRSGVWIADIPTALWFSYVYVHNHCAQPVAQRLKMDSAEFKCEKLAHLTHHIFSNGFLPAKLRCFVHWELPCGKILQEHSSVVELLESGEGACEDKPLRLIIGQSSLSEL